MYIDSISNSRANLSLYNPKFKGRNVTKIQHAVLNTVKLPLKTLQAMFLSGVLMFGATGCKDALTPPTKNINAQELEKHSDLTPEQLDACANAIKELLGIDFLGDEYIYYGISYNTECDSNVVLVYNEEHISYNKETKSFHRGKNKIIQLKDNSDGSFSLINDSGKFQDLFTQLDFSKDAKLLKRHYLKEKEKPAEAKITEGLVKDRSEEEIMNATGLTKAQLNTVINAIKSIYNSRERGKKGVKCKYVGTDYEKGIFSDDFLIKFEMDDKDITFTHKKNDKKQHVFKTTFLEPSVKLIEDEEGYTISDDSNSFYCEYNKDGITKSEIEKSNIISTMSKDAENIKLLKSASIPANTIAKVLYELGYKNVDGSSDNMLYLDSDSTTYRLNLKGSQNNYEGLAFLTTDSGTDGIYGIKIMIDDKPIKSTRIEISTVDLVQNGLDDSSPVQNKNVGTVKTETGRNKTNTTHSLNGTARESLLENIITLGSNVHYDGKLTSSQIEEIDRRIKETLPAQRMSKTIIIDKATGKITIKGR